LSAVVVVCLALPGLASANFQFTDCGSTAAKWTNLTVMPDPITGSGAALPFRWEVTYDPATNAILDTELDVGAPQGAQGGSPFRFRFPVAGNVIGSATYGAVANSLSAGFYAAPGAGWTADGVTQNGQLTALKNMDSTVLQSVTVTLQKNDGGAIEIPGTAYQNIEDLLWLTPGAYYMQLQAFDPNGDTSLCFEMYFDTVGLGATAPIAFRATPTITKAFGAASMAPGDTTSLTFTLTNANASITLTGVGFTDTLPAGLQIADQNGLTGSCGGGTITAPGATPTLSLTGATLPASGSCSFSVNVVATSGGRKDNTTSAVTSNEMPSGSAATATLTVAATVMFNSNGGSAVPNQLVAFNNTAATPAPPPTKAGSTFAGWYSDAGLTTLFNFATPITADITLYAKWTLNTYTVTFNSNAGSAVPSQVVNHNATATAPAPPPTKAGSTFAGWYVDAALTTLFNFATPITADITLFAKWALVSFTAPSPTGTGDIAASFSGGGVGCGFTSRQFVPVGAVGAPAPAGVTFPHGLFAFTVDGCSLGAILNFTVVYPHALPPETQYWKYGPTPVDPAPHWYVLPAVIVGNTVTFSITDGGLGDDDLVANGVIVDQGGPGVPSVAPIPTLSTAAFALLTLLLVGFGAYRIRGRRSSAS
jgi:uncharacterized repeat protein (TIGR02543 family)/uncharacterized repeat protein (TIGR01451 family)